MAVVWVLVGLILLSMILLEADHHKWRHHKRSLFDRYQSRHRLVVQKYSSINPYSGIFPFMLSIHDSAIESLKATQALSVSLKTPATQEMARLSIERAWRVYADEEFCLANNEKIIEWAVLDVILVNRWFVLLSMSREPASCMMPGLGTER